MNNPCELCSIKNTCGHAGGKPDKYQCGQRWGFNLIAARDKEWVEWARETIHGCYSGLCKFRPTCSDLTFACPALLDRKKEIGL